MTAGAQRRGRWRRTVLGMLLVDAVVVLGVGAYLTGDAHRLHDPNQALQQLDAFYLDEPAPDFGRLGLRPGTPALLVFCTDCRPPSRLPAQVRVIDDAKLARRYALLRSSGRFGPGYAVIDARGRVRYRTFDPGLGAHRDEIETLLERAR